MKYIKQWCIVGLVALLGDLLNRCLPLPIPGGVWGMVLLLLFLMTGVIKLHQVEELSNFLLPLMGVFFIPFTADFILMYSTIENVLVPLLVIFAVSTVIVILSTAFFVQWIRKKQGSALPEVGGEDNE